MADKRLHLRKLSRLYEYLASGENALNAFAGSSIVRIFPRRAFSHLEGLLHHSDAGAGRHAPKMCIED